MAILKKLAPRALSVFLVVATAVLVVAHIFHAIFWRGHDPYDDTGYMLAIFRQLATGHTLYAEVFSQYGPFHGQAWLSFLGAFGFPIDHDHVGIGVLVLWTACAVVAGWAAKLATESVLAGCLSALWVAWSLMAFSNELGHPVSLCAFLVLASVATSSYARVHGGVGGLVLHALSGAMVAALVFTKINLGIFQGIALGLALLFSWDRGGRLSALGCLATLGLPVVLLGNSWPVPQRLVLGCSVMLPMVMLLLAWHRLRLPAVPWQREWLPWLGGLAVASLAMVAVAMMQGISLTGLLDGMLLRPLKLPGLFMIYPEVRPIDVASMAVSLLLAGIWLFASRGARPWPTWWPQLVVVTGLALVPTWIWLGFPWSMGMASLAWVPLTLGVDGPDADQAALRRSRALLVLGLAGAWQALGAFPVLGSQGCIPASLHLLLWTIAIGGMLTRRLPAGRWLRTGSAAALLGSTCWLVLATSGEHTRKVDRYAKFSAPGHELYSLPMEQAATLATVVSNVAQTKGPLFTSHGQHSLVLWAGKPHPNGFNCTYIAGLLSPEELHATVRHFQQEPAWASVIFARGRAFGDGPHSGFIADFLQKETRPWFRIQDYELRLSAGSQPPPMRHAVWFDGKNWMLSAPAADVARARKWRLRAPLQIGSGRWEAVPASPSALSSSEETSPDAGLRSYGTCALPTDVAAVMKKARADQLERASFWLCDKKWEPLSGVAVVVP